MIPDCSTSLNKGWQRGAGRYTESFLIIILAGVFICPLCTAIDISPSNITLINDTNITGTMYQVGGKVSRFSDTLETGIFTDIVKNWDDVSVSEAETVTISGYVYEGTPGDFSVPAGSVRVRLFPSNSDSRYDPDDMIQDVITNHTGFYQFQIVPGSYDVEYYHVILDPPSGSEPVKAQSLHGSTPDHTKIVLPYSSIRMMVEDNNFWILYPPSADFDTDILSGITPLTVQFTDRSEGNPSLWSWDFGDGIFSSLQNPAHTYSDPGTYMVTLTAFNTAGGTTVRKSIVGRKPVLKLSPSSGNVGSEVTVTGSNFGSEPGLHAEEIDTRGKAAHAGNYVDISFANTRIADKIPISDNGSITATFTVPAMTAPGQHAVVADDGEHSAEAMFTVENIPPVAGIDAFPLSGYIPLRVHFSANRSTDPDAPISSYQWDFGDGNREEGSSPVHVYQNPGIYQAILTVTDTQGVSDYESVRIIVERTPLIAAIDASPLTGNAPLPVKFSASRSEKPGGSISSYRWDFGDNTESSGINADHTYQNPGEYDTTLSVADNEGIRGSTSVRISVGNPLPGEYPAPTDDNETAIKEVDTIVTENAPPVARITTSSNQGTMPLSITVDGSQSSDPDGNNLSYAWNFGEGGTENGRIVSHTYKNEGEYLLSLTVTDPGGRTGKASETIKVYPPFPYWIVLIVLSGCIICINEIRKRMKKKKTIPPKTGIPIERIVGPGEILPENCEYPAPKPGYEIRSGVKYHPGTTRELPDLKVEYRSGIWREKKNEV
jgi:PKD repeat protein